MNTVQYSKNGKTNEYYINEHVQVLVKTWDSACWTSKKTACRPVLFMNECIKSYQRNLIRAVFSSCN